MAPGVDTDVLDAGLSRGQLERALEREERIAAALRDVGNAIGTTLEEDDLFESILPRLLDLVAAEQAILFVVDEPAQTLDIRFAIPQADDVLRIPVGEGLVGRVARSGRPLRIDDPSDPRFDPRWDVSFGSTFRNALAAPLKNNLGRTIGVLEVVNCRVAKTFSREDEAILTALSTQTAVAIDNSHLLKTLIEKNLELSATKDQLERRVRDLKLLFELERSTAAAASHEELARAVLERLARACDARGAALLLRDEETGTLVEYALDVEAPAVTTRAGVTDGLAFQVMADNAPAHRAEPADTPPEGLQEAAFVFPIQTAIAEPLDGEGEALGALALYDKQNPNGFSKEDLGLLRLVSANLSTAVRLFNANRVREREERLTSIGRLLSQVIHDFRSPMTVISGYVQLMEESDDPAQRRRYAEEILQQFEAVASMQREVLAFARGESDVFVRRVYVDRFFADLARQVRHELEKSQVELVLEVEPKLVARFDTERITRALFNLMRNALDAMGEGGGRLTVGAQRRGSDLILFVEDTGPGIPDAVKTRLFQSFVTANKKEGTGLGLAIVKRIVEQHGGDVSVESSSSGARFELRLPEQFGPEAAPKVIEAPRKAGARKAPAAKGARQLSPRTTRSGARAGQRPKRSSSSQRRGARSKGS